MPGTTDDLTAMDELVHDGHLRQAIDELQAAVRMRPDPVAERELVRLRHRAFWSDEPVAQPTPAPVPRSSGLPDGPIPVVAPADLSIGALRSALSSHGALRIDGLLSADQVTEWVDGIDGALAGCTAALGGSPATETAPWFAAFKPELGEFAGKPLRRSWVRAGGGVWTADSPRMTVQLMSMLGDSGIGALATEFLGERPVLSVNKCTLRLVEPGRGGGWHQDGAFLGPEIRSLNLWIALSPCGIDAPTLDVVPRRLDELVPTGTAGATFPWSASPDVVSEAAGPVGIERLHFEAGDALLFDHLFLHRTGATPEMPNQRYAIETWMFAPSTYPEGQIPLVY